MITFPVNIDLKVVNINEMKYGIDTITYNIFHFNELSIDIINLLQTYNDDNIIDKLEHKYLLKDIRKEILNIKKLIDIGKISIREQRDRFATDLNRERITKINIDDFLNKTKKYYNDNIACIIELTRKQIKNLNYFKSLYNKNLYFVIKIDEDDLLDGNYQEINTIPSFLNGRYRIIIKSDKNLFDLYTNVKDKLSVDFDIDISILEECSLNEESLRLFKDSLFNEFNNDILPRIGIINDMITYIYLRQTNEILCSYHFNKTKECDSINCLNYKVCELYNVFYQIAIANFIKLAKSKDYFKLQSILIKQINSRVTNNERIILGENIFWQNTVMNVQSKELIDLYKRNIRIVNFDDCI